MSTLSSTLGGTLEERYTSANYEQHRIHIYLDVYNKRRKTGVIGKRYLCVRDKNDKTQPREITLASLVRPF